MLIAVPHIDEKVKTVKVKTLQSTILMIKNELTYWTKVPEHNEP